MLLLLGVIPGIVYIAVVALIRSNEENTGDYKYYSDMSKYFEGAKAIEDIFEDRTYDTLVNEVKKYLVPVRAISETFGVAVDWDSATQSVKLSA